jgi:hypothetical protein
LRQWLLAPIVVVTIAFGWRYPWLGFTVPASMFLGIVGGLRRGRYVCGNLCPRGSFFDRIMAPLAARRGIPSLLRSMPLRWGVFTPHGYGPALAANPTISIIGVVFWSMCGITTVVGVVCPFYPRSWCRLPGRHPVKVIGGGRHQLSIDPLSRVRVSRAGTFDLRSSGKQAGGAGAGLPEVLGWRDSVPRGHPRPEAA